MKLALHKGVEKKKSRRTFCLAFLACTAAAALWLAVALKPPAVPPIVQAAHERGPKAADFQWAALPLRESIGKPAAELFLPQSWSPARTRVRVPAATPLPQEPVPLVLPYRVAGTLLHEHRPYIVLAKGDAIFMVWEGDTLDEDYRVVAIGRDHITLLYEPLGRQETLPLTSALIDREKPSLSQQFTP
jgi:hypothetical protein